MGKRYFMIVTTYSSTKIGEWVADEVAKKYDHRIMSADRWKNVKDDIKTIMDAGKENFPRCKQLTLQEYVNGGEYDHIGYGEHPRLSLQKAAFDSTPAFVLDTYIIRED